MKRRIFFSISIAILFSVNTTYVYSQSAEKKDLSDISWLAGTWEGPAFGGTGEEVWTVQADGTMMGMYRNVVNGKVRFYEFMLLDHIGIKIKHFNPDLGGWEEKDEYEEFSMIQMNEHMIELDGLIFENVSENELRIRLTTRQDGKTQEFVFDMTRRL